MGGHALTPPKDRRLGKPLPYQLPNLTHINLLLWDSLGKLGVIPNSIFDWHQLRIKVTAAKDRRLGKPLPYQLPNLTHINPRPP